MKTELGRLEKVPLRQVWPDEARDFTPWLALSENVALLAEALHLGEFRDVRTEVPVGSFFIDILSKDDDENLVVVENQFGATDHRHLGQILTYVGGQEGPATVIWIAESFRDEHRAAIDWLNASTKADFNFFAVEVEAFRIGSSPPAPHFKVVAFPNDWSRTVTRATRSGSGTLDDWEKRYTAFWTGFSEFLKERRAQWKLPDVPPSGPDCSFGIGRSGVRLIAWAGMRHNRLGVGLHINVPTKNAFDALHENREAIESEFGEELDWLRQDGKVRSRIDKVTTAFPLSDREKWPSAYIWLLDRMDRFRNVFRARIQNLQPLDAQQVSE